MKIKVLGLVCHISRLHPFVRRSQSSKLLIMFLDEYSEYIMTRMSSGMSCGVIATALSDPLVSYEAFRRGLCGSGALSRDWNAKL